MAARDGRGSNTRHRPLSAPLGSLLHILLRYGEGLWLGPDCDGCLNLCLPPSGTPADALKEASHPPHHPPSTPGSSSSKPLSPGAKDACQLSPGQWPAVAEVPAALPAAAYSLSALLSAGQLEGSYGAAAKPRGVVTTPKHFQLQVRPGTRRLLVCCVSSHQQAGMICRSALQVQADVLCAISIALVVLLMGGLKSQCLPSALSHLLCAAA